MQVVLESILVLAAGSGGMLADCAPVLQDGRASLSCGSRAATRRGVPIMITMRHPLSIAGLAVLLCLSASASDALDQEAAARARAEAAANALGSTLKQALQARMQAEGPLAAVDFCHQQAQSLTAQVANEHGVRLGRLGLRLRNPDNAVSDWQQAALEQMAASHDPAAASPRVSVRRSADGARLNYVRAIRTEAPCLLCHGSKLSDSLLAAIRERYPEDRATGFAEGDLRGLLWVEVPLGEGGDR
jgi:hypothetical protein